MNYLRNGEESLFRKCISKIKDSNEYDYTDSCTSNTWRLGYEYFVCIGQSNCSSGSKKNPWGLFGLANMLEFINEVRQITPNLSLMGVAITKVDGRKNYFKQTIQTLKEVEDVHLFEALFVLTAP